MSVEIRFDAGKNFFVVRIAGDTDAETVAEVYAIGISGPDYRQNMNVIWDISSTTLSRFSIAEVRRLVQLVKQHSQERGSDYKVALVAGSSGDRQLLRVYSSFIKMAGRFRMRVFSDSHDAVVWITAKESS